MNYFSFFAWTGSTSSRCCIPPTRSWTSISVRRCGWPHPVRARSGCPDHMEALQRPKRSAATEKKTCLALMACCLTEAEAMHLALREWQHHSALSRRATHLRLPTVAAEVPCRLWRESCAWLRGIVMSRCQHKQQQKRRQRMVLHAACIARLHASCWWATVQTSNAPVMAGTAHAFAPVDW